MFIEFLLPEISLPGLTSQLCLLLIVKSVPRASDLLFPQVKYHGHGLPRWYSGKVPACQCRRFRNQGFDPWVRKVPWRRKWQPIPMFLPGKLHGQRSLASYSPQGPKESDRTEWLRTCTKCNDYSAYLKSGCADLKNWIFFHIACEVYEWCSIKVNTLTFLLSAIWGWVRIFLYPLSVPI